MERNRHQTRPRIRGILRLNSLDANTTKLLPGDHNLPNGCVGFSRRYHCFIGHQEDTIEKSTRSRTPVPVIMKDRPKTPAEILLALQRLLPTAGEKMRDDLG